MIGPGEREVRYEVQIQRLLRRPDAEHLRYIILPAITMSVIPMGVIARTVRALVADILDRFRIVRAQTKNGNRILGDVKRTVTGKTTRFVFTGMRACTSIRRCRSGVFRGGPAPVRPLGRLGI